jgi:molybdate transport system substrate-binding protein
VKRLLIPFAAAVAAALALVGCSSSDTGGTTTATSAAATSAAATSAGGSSAAGTTASSPGTAASSGAGDLSGELTIFAAASLKKGFDELRDQFQTANPGVTVKEITYDGSSALVTQIQGGAQVDVFASADTKNMDKITDMVDTPVEFATNTLQIAVTPGNPKGITGLADLAKPGVTVVLCAPEVPCGSAAHTALDKAGVSVSPVSEEQNVTAVLTKVASGDADAGLVYRTDVISSDGKVDGVDFPEAAGAVNHYPIAALKEANNPDAAKAFIDLVTSDAGQAVLADLGFGKPGT